MPSLEETDPALIAALAGLFDQYGAAGVAATVTAMRAAHPQVVVIHEEPVRDEAAHTPPRDW